MITELELILWFKAASDQSKQVWNAEKVDSLFSLKYYEHFTEGLGKGSCQTEFEFLSQIETARFQLGEL